VLHVFWGKMSCNQAATQLPARSNHYSCNPIGGAATTAVVVLFCHEVAIAATDRSCHGGVVARGRCCAMQEPPPPLPAIEEVMEHLHYEVHVHVGYPTISHEHDEVVMVLAVGDLGHEGDKKERVRQSVPRSLCFCVDVLRRCIFFNVRCVFFYSSMTGGQ
jgi:hypothetical protein